ncbi:MAG: MiaB-like tRNA modifying enzyme [Proteobacteria bacterium]|nr:MiaB-like tRNA modifying enzyme [Pseudomonadota bacterium]
MKNKVGKTITVLVDETGPEGAIARSAADAPEIDGRVIIRQGAKLRIGEFIRVKVTKSDAHDLWATPAGPRAA